MFLIFVLVWRDVTFKLTVFHLWQTNFASYKESTGSTARGLFIWWWFLFLEIVKQYFAGIWCLLSICWIIKRYFYHT